MVGLARLSFPVDLDDGTSCCSCCGCEVGAAKREGKKRKRKKKTSQELFFPNPGRLAQCSLIPVDVTEQSNAELPRNQLIGW